ncbi:glycine betaine/L-proline ABC transporter ATP-binding protein [Endozoicomonas sp. 8E]|uniref:quaternary amine ABC transporter ATP-binding protein n=1 Tax=Endozoicomonas sp. 8E TaxID=3035692 RepID=UPI0029390E99|nr:glycine betaine/L-proline ABC transporter ATP-binding protein [Endozoicomonas sp. 8E]WOG27714.1 glycine betaine/L-proline ABC transporter ATP-binding protein [Endozoicomonas sp. 8E]
MSELICVRNLYKIFGKTPERALTQVKSGLGKSELLEQTQHGLGLKAINLSIKREEIFVIMGLSGSGKSTLIRHFNRLIEPTEGDIIVDGINVMKLGKRELEQFRRQKMSMVFQRFGLLPHRSVIDNVSYGLKVQGLSKAERLKKAQQWLETVGLKGYEDQFPAQLSGGQQQRVGLARALCTDAEILLMDEAFSALDPLIRSEMQDQLIELQEKLKKTILFITHDLDEALRLGDRIAILKDGELVQMGKPEDILLNPATDYVEAFVKDVNRARALTVETVMQPPVNRITANTIGEALEQMKKLPKRYGYYFNEQGYQGIVLQDTLEQAAQTHAGDTLGEEMVEELEAVSPDAILETVIPDTLETDYPLPVVDETGEFQGELSRTNLIEVLGETSSQAA